MDRTKSSTSSKHTNIPTVQNTFLIWLDGSIDKNNDKYGRAIQKFQGLVNTVETFIDSDECIQYIHNLKNEKIQLVVSGSLGQDIVPRIHDLSQVDSIFIFCNNKPHHEKWAKNWAKIKGIYTDISPICAALKQSEQNTGTMNSRKTIDSSGVVCANLDQLDSSFMYGQILKEILLSIQFKQKHIEEFVDFCRKQFSDNEGELNNIKIFEQKYSDKTPIWWFNHPCFLFPMIDRALKMMDMNILIKIGFFIHDLHRQIEELHSEQFRGHNSDKIFTVYRGQDLSKSNFDQISKTKGGFIFFNNFLTTSKDRQIALDLARRTRTKPDSVGILFVMTIDLSKPAVPFASTADISCSPNKHEILFSMHTVFRIDEIKPIDGKRDLFQIDLKLTSENDDDLSMLTDHLRVQISQHTNGWYQLGLLLFKMNQIELAQNIYEGLLKETSDESEKEKLYYQIGLIKFNQHKYDEAIKYFKKALEIGVNIRSPDDSYLASSFSNIGSVYEKINNYSKAIESYEKTLKIYQRTRPPNHPDLVSTYNSIGSVYNHQGDHLEALSFYVKALQIQERTLPSNHPDLASSYNNMGMTYKNLNEFSKAVSFLERAVSTVENSLPPNDPVLKVYKDNLNAAKKSS